MTALKFLKGTQEAYDALDTYDEGTFYYTGTNLYLGTLLLTNEAEISEILAEVAENTKDIAYLEEVIGSLDNLDTAAKTSIVDAINEVFKKTEEAVDLSAVTISKDGDKYTFYQGETAIGEVDIPADLVVKEGYVEVNPAGQEEGTYLVIVLNDADSTTIYINVGDLVQLYTVQEDATQIQLSIVDNQISATIVAGAVGMDELADDSVTTAKICDANVTYDKLSLELRRLLDDLQEETESAVHSVTTGTKNGTISVDGEDVTVAGLKSAAYTDVDDIVAEADAYADELLNHLGSLEDLETATKTSFVDAVNELVEVDAENLAASKVTMTEDSNVYTIYQGEDVVGQIDIPDDMIVKDGYVAINPDGQEPGTYIVLVLADEDETKIYVNVGDLITFYTVEEEAAQVQLQIVGTEISATLVAGSVGTEELADDAVTAVKIKEANVTTEKLSIDVQEAIAKGEVAEENAKAYADELFSQVEVDLDDLTYEDEPEEGKVVTSVSQKDGLITVTKADTASMFYWEDFE